MKRTRKWSPPLEEQGGLVQVAELGVGDPQTLAGHGLAGQWHDARHQAYVVGVAVGVGGHGHGEAVGGGVGDEDLAAEELAGPAARGHETLGGLLDLLAVEDDEGEAAQAGGDVGAGHAGGKEAAQAFGEAGEEALGQRQGQAGELAVDGPGLDGERAGVEGRLEGAVGGAVVACEGVGEGEDDLGEGEDVGVATPAVGVEDVLEDVVGGDVRPGHIEGLGEGKPACKRAHQGACKEEHKNRVKSVDAQIGQLHGPRVQAGEVVIHGEAEHGQRPLKATGRGGKHRCHPVGPARSGYMQVSVVDYVWRVIEDESAVEAWPIDQGDRRDD